MLVIKLLISNCVGQDFWHGASAHFKQRAASRRAARSDNVVCFMSEKSFCKLVHDYEMDWTLWINSTECWINTKFWTWQFCKFTWHEWWSAFRFHNFFSFFCTAVGLSDPLVWTRGFNTRRFWMPKKIMTTEKNHIDYLNLQVFVFVWQ